MAVQIDAKRFATPTDALRLEELLRRQRGVLYRALAVAIVLLAIPVIYLATREEEKKAPKPPLMHLVVRKPRLTKAFEFEKQQIPKRQMTRQVRAAKPQITRKPQIRLPDLVGKIKTFRFGVASGADLGLEVVQPEVQRVAIKSPKEPEKRISMQEEFLDLEALDIGRYKGLVVQDPADKQNITGFVYLALAWGNDFKPSTQRAIFELVEAINGFTQIRAEVDDHLFLDSRAIFRAPFVYISVDQAFEPTQQEIANLGDYLRQGGFVMVEAMGELGRGRRHRVHPGRSLTAGNAQGFAGDEMRASRSSPTIIPYTTAFTISTMAHRQSGLRKGLCTAATFIPKCPFLEGISLGDRLVAIFTTKEYGRAWEKEFRNEPQLQMGVNLVVFALTQQGSIAQQQIDFYTEQKPMSKEDNSAMRRGRLIWIIALCRSAIRLFSLSPQPSSAKPCCCRSSSPRKRKGPIICRRMARSLGN